MLAYKDSANRAESQIYLSFSEVQPIFDEVKDSAKFRLSEQKSHLFDLLRLDWEQK